MKKLQLKKHVLTGIAYMIPVVVAGGICLGIPGFLEGWIFRKERLRQR